LFDKLRIQNPESSSTSLKLLRVFEILNRSAGGLFARCGLAVLLLACQAWLQGCIYTDEPVPRIVVGGSLPTVPPPAPAPSPPKPAPSPPRLERGSSAWYPPSYLEKNWTAVVIHHSATDNGNTAIFDKWHREGNHWDGVGYHFVIGNGTDSGDGVVEPTYRWRGQKTGAHCGGTAGNWANEDGVGICLVGNFNKTAPTRGQMQSLLRLARFLQARYRIPKSRVYGHGGTPGANRTDCPGRKFPMYWLKTRLLY
jgi:hypothetical protein